MFVLCDPTLQGVKHTVEQEITNAIVIILYCDCTLVKINYSRTRGATLEILTTLAAEINHNR